MTGLVVGVVDVVVVLVVVCCCLLLFNYSDYGN